MGYRHYMYTIPKKIVNEIKDLSYEELKSKYSKDEYFSLLHDSKIAKQLKEIYGFGKLYYDDTAERIYNKGVPMFTNNEVMENLSYYHPYLVGEYGLLEAIEIYRNKVLNYYKSLLEDGETHIGYFGIETKVEKPKEQKWKEHIDNMIREWKHLPYNIDKSNDDIISSWKYEYGIFELVRLYKTIDFNKYDIVFLGY